MARTVRASSAFRQPRHDTSQACVSDGITLKYLSYSRVFELRDVTRLHRALDSFTKHHRERFTRYDLDRIRKSLSQMAMRDGGSYTTVGWFTFQNSVLSKHLDRAFMSIHLTSSRCLVLHVFAYTSGRLQYDINEIRRRDLSNAIKLQHPVAAILRRPTGYSIPSPDVRRAELINARLAEAQIDVSRYFQRWFGPESSSCLWSALEIFHTKEVTAKQLDSRSLWRSLGFEWGLGNSWSGSGFRLDFKVPSPNTHVRPARPLMVFEEDFVEPPERELAGDDSDLTWYGLHFHEPSLSVALCNSDHWHFLEHCTDQAFARAALDLPWRWRYVRSKLIGYVRFPAIADAMRFRVEDLRSALESSHTLFEPGRLYCARRRERLSAPSGESLGELLESSTRECASRVAAKLDMLQRAYHTHYLRATTAFLCFTATVSIVIAVAALIIATLTN